jgi:Ca2+-binding RTX toxin-like protein
VLKYVGTGNATLTGTDAVNTLIGGIGNDTMNGLGGADTLEGGQGNDTMSGGGGADTLNGGDGGDTINGGEGADTINGGGGNDTMNGNAGNDVFVFLTGSGADIIAGFDANPADGQDKLDISGLGVLAGEFAAEVAIAASGANTLITIGGDTITLLNTNPNAITAADFIFG